MIVASFVCLSFMPLRLVLLKHQEKHNYVVKRVEV